MEDTLPFLYDTLIHHGYQFLLDTCNFYTYVNDFTHCMTWKNMSPRQCVWPPGICTTRDIDFMLNHINNGRYVRAMDFGRLDHCIRSGIFKSVAKSSATLLVAATTIRYRKPVYLFVPYRLQSQVSTCQKFIRNNFTYAYDLHFLKFCVKWLTYWHLNAVGFLLKDSLVCNMNLFHLII